jgi:hypothetical protein
MAEKHRKASAKTQLSLTRFLQSEVKIIHIIPIISCFWLHIQVLLQLLNIQEDTM